MDWISTFRLILRTGGRSDGDMMNDEKKHNDVGKGPENIAKVVIFAIVAIVMITSFVLPTITAVGERTDVITNEGVKVSSINQDTWDDMTSDYSSTPYIHLSNEGIYLLGYVNGVSTKRFLVHTENYDTSYPVMFIGLKTTQQDSITYDPIRGWYISTTAIQGEIDLGPSMQFNPVYRFTDGGEIWYQDPNGTRLMTKDSLIYPDGESDIFGINVEYGVSLYADLDTALVFVSGSGTSTGASDVESVDHDGYKELNSISYLGHECEYYFGSSQGYTYTYNILDGTQVGSLIGTIPVLIIIGLVLHVARTMKRSDR